MQKRQSKALDAGRRVQGFLDEHPEVGNSVTSLLREKLDDIVDRLASFGVDQQTAADAIRGETAAIRGHRRRIHHVFLRRIRGVAKRNLVDQSEQAAFLVPTGFSRKGDFMERLRIVAAATAANEAFFVANGLSANFLADLGPAIDQLEAAIVAQSRSQSRRREATEGVRLMDKALREVFAELDEALAPQVLLTGDVAMGWEASKKIHQVGVAPMAGGDGDTDDEEVGPESGPDETDDEDGKIAA